MSKLKSLLSRLPVQLDPKTAYQALTHRSYAYENGGLPNNERLEFLGDAVLGLVVTDVLYRMHPDLPEGQLAKMRAAVVSTRGLTEVARRIELGEHIRLGRGEVATGGRDKPSILADSMEAIIGAVYLDSGLAAAAQLVLGLFGSLIEHASELGAALDWKTSLQELAAKLSLGSPEYVVDDAGPDHEKRFEAYARVGDQDFPAGRGKSKKQAEQNAAKLAWALLGDGD